MARALTRIGGFARGLSRWHAHVFAFACGVLSAFGFAPLGLFPLLLFGFAMLVVLIDGARGRKIADAAWLGWAFGFGQFLVGLHWIGYAFLVDPQAHEWQIPFVALLMPGGLALFTAAASAAAAALWCKGPSRIFVFAVAYAASEWLRGHVLTGFPWNIAGYGWGASLGVLQSVAVIGIYGLSFLTVLFGASLAALFEAPSRWRLPASLFCLFVALFAAGEIRLVTTRTATVPGVELRIVQPNIPQPEKYRRSLVVRNWTRLLDLSTRPAKIPPTHIVWPESAPPFLLAHNPVALDEITLLTGRSRTLITGAQRVELHTDRTASFYNSLYAFGPGGRLLATYDKFHLVPFGEYVPFAADLSAFGIVKLTQGEVGFSAGDGPHSFALPGAPPFGPLICYEILFPGEVVGRARPGWFVNVTDDSWFGPWAGPLQHLLVARTRAIEEGIPVIRSANTGVSAIIDPLGRLTGQLGLDQMGVVDGPLPAAIVSTPYGQVGDLGFLLLLAAGAVISAMPRLRRS